MPERGRGQQKKMVPGRSGGAAAVQRSLPEAGEAPRPEPRRSGDPTAACMDEEWRLSEGASGSGSSRRGVGGGRREAAFLERRSSPSRKWRCFAGRCASRVRERRARFYIVRRCVVMLVCWRECRDR